MKEKETIQDGKRVTVWLSDSVISRVDRLADKAEMDRGRLLRQMIEVTTETLEESEKVGLLQFGLIMRDMKEALHRWVQTFKGEGFKRFLS